MPVVKSRKYCCICSNYRGKNVEGRTISLHRFPASTTARRVWLQRCRLMRKDFVYTINCQMCSDHFVGLRGPTKEHPLPSIFPNKIFGTSAINPVEMEPMDITEPTHPFQDMESQECNTDTDTFVSSSSAVHTSVIMHDYCGKVDLQTVSHTMNQSVQTSSFTHTLSVDNAVQCNDAVLSCDSYTQTQYSVSPTVDEGIQTIRPGFTYEDIKHSDQKVMFYTGVPDATTFEALFNEIESDAAKQTARSFASSEQGRPRYLRIIDEFFLVFIRLRLGLLLEDLADRFNISTSLCCVIFNKWVDYLDVQFSFLVKWPTRKAVDDHMPESFRQKYPKCRVILDCTEIRTETPASLQHKSLMYSDYKSHMTWKGLVGISPAGVVTFVSDLWTGSISDKVITRRSNLLELCETGDAIMVDKGFLISDITTAKGIDLIIPPFKQQKRRLSRREVDETRTIANLRIHVERQMERIKNFNILDSYPHKHGSSSVKNMETLCKTYKSSTSTCIEIKLYYFSPLPAHQKKLIIPLCHTSVFQTFFCC